MRFGVSVLILPFLIISCEPDYGWKEVGPPEWPVKLEADSVICMIKNPDEITHNHIWRLLISEGIPAAPGGGGRTQSIKGPKDERARALMILREDNAKRAYYALIDGEHYRPEPDAWADVVEIVNYSALLQEQKYGPGTELGAVLRHKRVSKVAAQIPQVSMIRSWRATRQGSDGTQVDVLEVDIVLGGGRIDDQAILCLQVSGKTVLFRGGPVRIIEK